MLYFIFLLLILIKLSNCINVCDPRLPLCSPNWGETWYHYNNYTFSRNENNTFFIKNSITSFDLHLLTFDTIPNVKRTIKSWFNLTQPNLAVRVTDNWFPSSLPSGSANKTWTFFAFLLDHDSPIDPTYIDVDQVYVEFKVVQTAIQPFIIEHKALDPWMIALITVSCVLIVSIISIAAWCWKRRMEKKAVLSKPDAILIADKFREVMSTSDLAQRNEKNAQDLLQRQLQAEEGTSIIEIKQSGLTINK